METKLQIIFVLIFICDFQSTQGFQVNSSKIQHGWRNRSLIHPNYLNKYSNKSVKIIQGDILIAHDDHARFTRAGIRDEKKRWPGALVPYYLDKAFSKKERGVILEALKELREKTCVQFQELSTPPKKGDFVNVKRGPKTSGCNSFVGRQGIGGQEMNIAEWCIKHGNVLHEFMHALGFEHEQSRPDRDEFVIINHRYIERDSQNNFELLKHEKYTTFDVPYDYGSIMHYHGESFTTRSGLKTISPKMKKAAIGQREHLSPLDILKVRIMYNLQGKHCEGKCGTQGQFQCADNPKKCLDPKWVCDSEKDCKDGSDEKNCLWKITLYEHQDHKGRSLTVSGLPGHCANLHERNGCNIGSNYALHNCINFNDQTRSVNTHGGCIKLYYDKDCTGQSKMLDPKKPGKCTHANLNDCDFFDKASSAQSC